jgi:hypothetical protein
MGLCSIWIYVDATSKPVRVEYESTCERLYRCSSEGCKIVDVSSKFKDKLQVRDLSSLLPLTPSNPTLWQPFPPYARADISIVVDSHPHVELYGLPLRKATVLTLIKRTLLEGASQLQLVQIGGDDVVLGESEALVGGWLGFEISYPLLPKAARSNPIAAYCHEMSGIERWGRCLYEYYSLEEHVLDYAGRLRRAASARGYGVDVVAMAMRLYAGLAVASGFSPLELAEAIVSHGTFSPLVVRGDELKPIHPEIRLGAKCSNSGMELYADASTVLKAVREYGCDSLAIICRRCWQKMSELGGETAV